jgi:hypothetical protein
LQKSIKTGQPISRDRLRFIDTCEFWKDQYTKIHSDKKALQDKVHELEEARRQLLERLHGQINLPLLSNSNRQLLEASAFNDQMGNEASRKRPAPAEEHRTDDQGEGRNCILSSEDHSLRISSYGKLAPGQDRDN